MIVYLVRHGVAVEREDWAKSDESRPLTDEGTDRMADAARGLRRIGISVGRVFTSPLARARQTADILVKELDLAKPELMDCLAPGHPTALVLKELSDLPAESSVMLVGHEPDMGDLAAFLTGAARGLPFKKGAVMAVSFEGRAGQGGGRILWYMPTKILKQFR
ncbi:phosphohistidine phosphatase SixA [bacterium]|nr:phosphohistidine phosphatase SixA [bacterium]